ncbi:MAG: hypothetical protein EON90_03500 [Brevundimonas sp.]|nr:MAG: hypothetical protein EON90_03500 [Brevundimonas sp.]
MSKFKTTAKLMAIAALLSVPAAAHAGDKSATFTVRASVPVACWVRFNEPLVAQTGSAGDVVEACNSPGGFVVSASYRPLKASESASFIYGGKSIMLNGSGSNELRQSVFATIRSVEYRFDEVTVDEPLALTLVIAPR